MHKSAVAKFSLTAVFCAVLLMMPTWGLAHGGGGGGNGGGGNGGGGHGNGGNGGGQGEGGGGGGGAVGAPNSAGIGSIGGGPLGAAGGGGAGMGASGVGSAIGGAVGSAPSMGAVGAGSVGSAAGAPSGGGASSGTAGGSPIGGAVGPAPAMVSVSARPEWGPGQRQPSFADLIEAGSKAEAAARSAFRDLPQLPQPIISTHRPASSVLSTHKASRRHRVFVSAGASPPTDPANLARTQFAPAGNRIPHRYFHPRRRNRAARPETAALPLHTTIVNDE